MTNSTGKPSVTTSVEEKLYFSSKFPTREALEAEIEFWDATTAGWVARCPRYGEYKIREGLTEKGEAYYKLAGKCIHAGLATYYTTFDRDLSMATMTAAWGLGRDFRLPPGNRWSHLHLGHLEVVLNNYFDFAEKRDTFKPITVVESDLDLSRVVAAVWQIAPDGRIILGESKIVMEFEVEGEPFFYCGRPDLPVEQSGRLYILDHKTTSSYLSEWFFGQHRFSNQLRGYCKMLNELLHLDLAGALINGVYVGDRAALSDFRGDKFARYGPMLFRSSHLDEAILNQYHWRKVLDYYEEVGYYPQHTGVMCRSCEFGPLCESHITTREHTKSTEFTRDVQAFLDL